MGILNDFTKKIKNWVNNFLDEELTNDPKMLNEGQGISGIMEQQDTAYTNYNKTKDQIDYWQREINKFSTYIYEHLTKLKDETYVKSLTPQKYDSIRATIDRALYSLEFAQQSLEKLLIIKAITPEQTKQFTDAALEKFNNKKVENDAKIVKLNKLKDYVDMYTARENIVTNTEKILNSNDDEEIFKLFAVIKYEYNNLKQLFIKLGNPENAHLLDEQYEELDRKFNIDHDIDYVKDFLKTNKMQNSRLIDSLKGNAKSLLDLKGEYSLDTIKELLKSQLTQTKKDDNIINSRIDILSSMNHKKAIKYLTLDLYAYSQEDAEITDINIKETKYKNYNLSPKLESLLNKNAQMPPKGIRQFFRDNFDSDFINQKKELAIAMYPFLSDEDNKNKLEDYIIDNSDFLNKLIYSGITPELLINEQENMRYMQEEKIKEIKKEAMKTSIDTNEYLKGNGIKRNPLSYSFVNDSMQQFFKFDDKFIARLKSIPQKTPDIKFETYVHRLAEHLNGIAQGKNEKTVKDDYSIYDFDERKKKAKESRHIQIENDNSKTGPIDIYSYSSVNDKSEDQTTSLKNMIDDALADKKANSTIKDIRIEPTTSSANEQDISLKDMIDNALAGNKANSTKVELTQPTQSNPNNNDNRTPKQRFEDLLKEALDFDDR